MVGQMQLKEASPSVVACFGEKLRHWREFSGVDGGSGDDANSPSDCGGFLICWR